MPSSGKFRLQPDSHDFQRNPSSQDTGSEAQHVGVVVFTAHPGSIDVKTIGCPDAAVPVGGNRHPDSGSADEYPALAFPVQDALNSFFDIIWIIHGLGRITTDIDDLMTGLSEILSDDFLQFKTAVIGCKDYLHLSTSKGNQSTGFFMTIAALVPPKPKEFDIAVRMVIFLAIFGT